MKKILFTIMSVGLAIGLIGGAFAYFSDTATSGDNIFRSGTLSITNEELTTATTFDIPNMAPGDVTGDFSVIIRNDGSINLAWLGDWQFGGNTALMNALYIADAKMQFLAPDGITPWLDDAQPGYEAGMVDHFITNGMPTGPYGIYLPPVGSFGVYTFNAWNDNPGMVPGSVYEHAGFLKPGYTYKLTVKFGLAAGAGNEYQNLGPTTAKLQVNAAQINSAALQLAGVPVATANEWTVPVTGWAATTIADQVE